MENLQTDDFLSLLGKRRKAKLRGRLTSTRRPIAIRHSSLIVEERVLLAAAALDGLVVDRREALDVGVRLPPFRSTPRLRVSA